MIPRRFKRKKFFVTDGQTNTRRTNRRDSRNSDVDSTNTQYAEWDLNKISKTIAETLIALFLIP